MAESFPDTAFNFMLAKLHVVLQDLNCTMKIRIYAKSLYGRCEWCDLIKSYVFTNRFFLQHIA